MNFSAEAILSVLDQCCDAFSFPMLDNGYVYLAATRLSLYRSDQDWATVIEVFGFSPRAGLPDTCIQTFGSRLYNRDTPKNYCDQKAYEQYLAHNPNNEFRRVFPIEDGPWLDSENPESVADDAQDIILRGTSLPIPPVKDYARRGIVLEDPPRVGVFELCRYLAEIRREQVLCTAGERRVSVLPEMVQILQLEEWNHPDVVDDTKRPSGSETFQQLARVLVTGDIGEYRPTLPPNTHWSNWPEGGSF